MKKTKKDKIIMGKDNINQKIADELSKEESNVETEEVTELEATDSEEDIESELDIITKERDEFKDKWLRELASFDNFRKNTLKEKQDWIKYANEKIILDLCEILDNFERALSTDINANNFESYKKGVEMIYQQFNNLLKRNNVEKIEALGQEFDPNIHDAISSIPSEEEENIIVAVIQNGYKIGEKIVKHSRVAVSNGLKPEQNKENN
ncbi:MAG: nucleotide exchange factor GrpE [Candidatus Cloacimonetes bacterium]|nr:nucleotide exchange factor GrpE [Candidatus Cloacimonadota bacterium]